MPRILVLYYSRTGNTKAMAEAVAKGARAAGATDVVVSTPDKAKVEDLKKFAGVIIGSPVYYGAPAAEIKKFLDDSVALHGKLARKVGGAFASSANVGGGNETTIMCILQALLIHGMVVEGDPSGDHYGPVSIGKPDKRAIDECARLGERVTRLAKILGGETAEG